MSLEERPVEPADLVVLAVGIVVAALRPPDLVAHQQHRRAQRQQRDGQEVLHLAMAQPLDLGIVRRPFDPAVPAQVRVGPVAAALPVRLVVLVVVADQVVQREPVVRRDEVDALLRPPFLVPVEIRAAEAAVAEGDHGIVVGLHEPPDVVAELAVPLLPGVAGEAARPGRARRRPTPRRSAWSRPGPDPTGCPTGREDAGAGGPTRRATARRRGRTGSRPRACGRPSTAGCRGSGGAPPPRSRSACCRCRCSPRSARGRPRGGSTSRCRGRGSDSVGPSWFPSAVWL